MESLITCPSCKKEFALSEAISRDIRAEFETEFRQKESQLNEKASAQVDQIRKEMEIKFRLDKAKIQDSLEKSIRDESRVELSDLQAQLKDNEEKLNVAMENEIKFRQAKRSLEDEKRNMELLMARKLDDERSKIKEEVGSRLSEEYSLQKLEWQKKQSDMEKLIEDLKRKSEQGSQQSQGEVLELEVESILQESFKHDSIEPVAKGVKGGDVLHRVMTRTGQQAGAILWEIKRTKNFSDAWLPKLRDDQRAAKADIAVIITTTMLENVKHIGLVDGVWVTDFQSFPGLALALRSSMIEVSQARQALVGKSEKMESLYSYLSGPEFRGKVETILEAFTTMREDLESEKRAIEKSWAKREKQLTRVLGSTAGMYGDLSGIIGASLPEIPALTMETADA